MQKASIRGQRHSRTECTRMTAEGPEEPRSHCVGSSKGCIPCEHCPTCLVGSDVSCTNEGDYVGFFRIPGVEQFLSYASLKLNNQQIAEIPKLFSDGGEFADLKPVYRRMGGKLVEMCKIENNDAPKGAGGPPLKRKQQGGNVPVKEQPKRPKI
jgi:hypothetical protein